MTGNVYIKLNMPHLFKILYSKTFYAKKFGAKIPLCEGEVEFEIFEELLDIPALEEVWFEGAEQ